MGTTYTQWRCLLEQEDYAAIYNALSRLVFSHPLAATVRATTPEATLEDLTQEAFLKIQKAGSWEYYRTKAYSDEYITRNISTLHIYRVLHAQLEKSKKETHRLAEKVLEALRAEADWFRSFSGPKGKASQEVYGLKEWPDGKPTKDPSVFPELISSIEVRRKYAKHTGKMRFLFTTEVAELLYDIFKTIDSPATVAELRQLVISRLPWAYSSISSLETPTVGDKRLIDRVPDRSNPDVSVIARELEHLLGLKIRRILLELAPSNEKGRHRVKMLCQILWQLYFSPEEPKLSQVATSFNLESSTVSMIQAKFINRVKEAGFAPDEQEVFLRVLEKQLRICMTEVVIPDQEVAKRSKAGSRKQNWFDELLKAGLPQNQRADSTATKAIAPIVDQVVDTLLSPEEKARNATDKLILRSQILLGLLESRGVRQIATSVGVGPSTVSFLKRDVGKTVVNMSINVAQRVPFMMVLKEQLQSRVQQSIAAWISLFLFLRF